MREKPSPSSLLPLLPSVESPEIRVIREIRGSSAPRDSTARETWFLQPEALHPMIVGIEDEYAPPRVAGDAPRLVELSLTAAVMAKGGEELPVGREFLHAVIAELAQIDMSVWPASQRRIVKQNVVGI